MHGMNIDRLNFETPTTLALALADRVAAELSIAVLERKRAILAVSGGKTPELFFIIYQKRILIGKISLSLWLMNVLSLYMMNVQMNIRYSVICYKILQRKHVL